MGIMKQQQQPQQVEQQQANKLNKKSAAASLNNLSKQNKTLHNQQLLKECQTSEEQSKIPVIRATARLMDFPTTSSLVGSSATIPPMRNNMRQQHHMLLRGRSRIRHHRRNCAGSVTVTAPCSNITARYYRDVSGIPRTQCNNNETRSVSATIDTDSNTLPQKEILGLRFSAPCHKNNNKTSLKFKNNNNNNTSSNNDNANDDPSSSDNSYSISSTSSITRPVIRRRSNASLSSTDTNLLNSQTTETKTTATNLDECGNYDISASSSVDDGNNNFKKCAAAESGSSSAGSCCTTVSAIKRNKRSLSSTRIEKDKCDEYNTKLLRKTTPPMANYANKKNKQINNNNTNNNNNTESNKQEGKKFATTTIVASKASTRLARTHASCHDVRTVTPKASVTARGGSFKEHNTRLYSTEYSTASSASTSTTTSGIPTPTSGLHNLYLTRAAERHRPHYQLSSK